MTAAKQSRPEAVGRTKKQNQRRLKSAEVEELVVAYQAGSSVYESAERFRVHRAPVSHVLEHS
jgi:hypothetical protein